MQYYEVAPVGIVRQTSATFTYHSQTPLEVGALVTFEVGKKTMQGVVVSETRKPAYATKEIISPIESTPLPPALVHLALWMSDYYATHLGTVWQTILPRGLTKARRERPTTEHQALRAPVDAPLTTEQIAALTAIDAMTPGSALLHGVTGSGKTRVYIEAATRVIAEGRSVIVLTPEIALTPQLVSEFSHHFNHLIVAHSRQTEAERHLAWRQALTSDHPLVVIGPRSALFMPLSSIGLVVIDEAHEPSYKQEQAPRYSALRAASILAEQHQAKVIMGSATPLVTDYYLARQSHRPIIEMKTSAKALAPADITLVDMTKRANFNQHRFLSTPLLERIDHTLEAGKQTLIFHNRRGSTTVTLCDNCGWQAGCARCFVPLTLHADHHELRCHICNATHPVPTSCPVCHHANIIHKGIGTKLIETELRKRYPNKKIVRFDGDTSSELTLDKSYAQLYDGSVDIIIGTQVVAKGLDLPHLRTVGIVQADAGLSLPDYSSSERTFQLLTQAIGRVGRDTHTTHVVVQTYQPDHPAVRYGIVQNYDDFYTHTIAERKRALFPPFVFLLKLTCVYKTEAAAIKNARKLADELRPHLESSTSLLGPTPAFYERQHDTYRWQLVLRSPSRSDLHDLLKFVPPQHWRSELDPPSLL